MSVERDLFMYAARFERPIELVSVRVAGSIEVGDATLSGLNLYGATIGKDLSFGVLGEGSAKWHNFVDDNGVTQSPMVWLWNASAGALVDFAGSWPNNIVLLLRDFTYERLTPVDKLASRSFSELRDAAWYINWLSRDPLFSFQPYRQLAAVLETYGEASKAQKILIAGRDRKLTTLEWSSPEKWSSWALRLIIGYGYGARELWALFWALPFLWVGCVVAQNKEIGASDASGERLGFWYSFDMLLPGIWLNEKHSGILLNRQARYYFYVHRLVGFVLLSFAVAGLAGLTA